MSDWVDTHDIGMDGVPDDFDSVADFDDGSALGGGLGGYDARDFGEAVGEGLTDADAWIVDLDLGGLADIADIAVVAGVEEVAGAVREGEGSPASGGRPISPPLLAHALDDVPDGQDPFAALIGRRLDDDELLNEIRHLRVKPPFGTAAGEEVGTAP